MWWAGQDRKKSDSYTYSTSTCYNISMSHTYGTSTCYNISMTHTYRTSTCYNIHQWLTHTVLARATTYQQLAYYLIRGRSHFSWCLLSLSETVVTFKAVAALEIIATCVRCCHTPWPLCSPHFKHMCTTITTPPLIGMPEKMKTSWINDILLGRLLTFVHSTIASATWSSGSVIAYWSRDHGISPRESWYKTNIRQLVV